MQADLIFGVSDFVAYLNQTLEMAYPYVTIEGELTNFRVSRGRWVYFDLKDDESSVKFFGTVYALPGPLEDGMVVRVSGSPRLHPQYGFSVNYTNIQPVGEGSLRKAADLLAAKLEKEGLFAPERKRALPYPPGRVALITAGGSAAYADFVKILNARWRGVAVEHFDVLVQGEQAPGQIVSAIAAANALAAVPDVLVLTRGGGSAEDLAAFSTEPVVRAVAGSRVPTLVAIGHEVDFSLAELAADRRASTPSNAAELLTPDRDVVLAGLQELRRDLSADLLGVVAQRQDWVKQQHAELNRGLSASYQAAKFRLQSRRQLLEAYDPTAALRRGYALDTIGREGYQKRERAYGRCCGGIAIERRHRGSYNNGQGETVMAKKAEFDYRAKADELERIVSDLQNPDIQIDEATKLHAAGLKLIGELEAYLNQAEIEVRKHITT